jgi:hypothetical protein
VYVLALEHKSNSETLIISALRNELNYIYILSSICRQILDVLFFSTPLRPRYHPKAAVSKTAVSQTGQSGNLFVWQCFDYWLTHGRFRTRPIWETAVLGTAFLARNLRPPPSPLLPAIKDNEPSQ